ncbi:MAG: substrate-binding domain-containing protein [Planctomycetaceae bacterium]|nr:substrate-binding domain-containing protein [Planctomycetaceae bacterium]
MKIYCDELFWSVLWEESAQFQRLYGKQVELLYNYPVDQNAETNNTDTDTDTEPAKKSYVPAPWRNMPKNENNKENKNKTATITLDNNITKIIFDLHETLPGDMYLTESNLQLTLLKEQLLVSREYPFCYLTMVLLVPKGNPLFIESVRDTIDRQLRLGIVEPSITGMGNAAWDIVTKINENKTTKNNNNSNEQIKIFNSIKNLLEALEQNQIDAALTWDACARRAEKYAEVVQLGKKKINNTNNPKTPNNTSTPEQENNTTKNNNTNNNEIDTNSEHRLLRVSIISLTIAEKEPHCRRFADFLISKEGQRILQRHGFVPTGK